MLWHQLLAIFFWLSLCIVWLFYLCIPDGRMIPSIPQWRSCQGWKHDKPCIEQELVKFFIYFVYMSWLRHVQTFPDISGVPTTSPGSRQPPARRTAVFSLASPLRWYWRRWETDGGRLGHLQSGWCFKMFQWLQQWLQLCISEKMLSLKIVKGCCFTMARGCVLANARAKRRSGTMSGGLSQHWSHSGWQHQGTLAPATFFETKEYTWRPFFGSCCFIHLNTLGDWFFYAFQHVILCWWRSTFLLVKYVVLQSHISQISRFAWNWNHPSFYAEKPSKNEGVRFDSSPSTWTRRPWSRSLAPRWLRGGCTRGKDKKRDVGRCGTAEIVNGSVCLGKF